MIKSRRFFNLLLVALLTFLALRANVLAQGLSQDDVNSIYNNTVWYDPSGATDCFGGSLTGVTAGAGAADGAQFPKLDPAAMASAINAWVTKENPQSTLSGLGSTIVAGAKNSNVSPFLIVAIAAEETSVADPNSYNVKYANNPFSREAAPGQPFYPGAGVNAGTHWYKWSSVKASVDYTASENQNAEGGGDIAAYIRNVYSGQLDAGDLLALFEKYAPVGDGNDPGAYAAKVTTWINDMVTLANGQPVNSGTLQITTPAACSGGISSGSIIQTAIGLSWPSGDHGPLESDATPAYQTALSQYNGSTDDPSDCGGFVATVMHASGADTSYVGVYVPNQYNYVSGTAAAKYQVTKAITDTSQLQPGDILMFINSDNPADSHTFIYVGQQAGFDGDGAGASLGGHVPQAVSAAASFAYNGRAASGDYMAVRLIQ